ncbi:MAG: GGDEF domain-containing protein [Firmicutes bacterium]|nr:GGDEF domain-containing protein [Bacillota bacterium]
MKEFKKGVVNCNTSLLLDKKTSFFYQVFQQSMFGQTIVNKSLTLLCANTRMFQYFHIKPYEARGLSFGEVFSCSELKFGRAECGRSQKCKRCAVWNIVRNILSTHIHSKDIVTSYSYHGKNHHCVKWFLVSGARVTFQDEPYVMLSFTDITRQKHQEDLLKQKLALDQPTGVMNKYSLMEAIQKLVKHDVANCFSLCMIDFDNFKEINDRCGHLMGDKVLKVFADIARKHIRKNDLLGRFGGEEFVFIFMETDQQQSMQILQRIHRELGKYFEKDLKISVTFSAGVIYVDHSICTLPQHYMELFIDVDRMLYQAKYSGKSRAMSTLGEILFRSDEYEQA